MSDNRRLIVACVGLGRMGRRHARNFALGTPRCQLVAVADPDPSGLEWAAANLSGVKRFPDLEAMLKEMPSIEAVVVATSTKDHAPLTIKCIEAGKHVMCEKPISLNLEEAESVLEASKARPECKVMIGFSRRFDASYRDAKKRSENLGDVFRIHSRTCDKNDDTGFFIKYSAASGGIFVDCAIHDIDLARWIFNLPDSARPIRVFASGTNASMPELAKSNDVDNAVGMVEWEGGKHLIVTVSRTTAHGHDVGTEIAGTEGMVHVNPVPALNRVAVGTKDGYVIPCHSDYWERFEPAFSTEAIEFVDAVLDNLPMPCRIEDGIEAGRIGAALQKSLLERRVIELDGKYTPSKL